MTKLISTLSLTIVLAVSSVAQAKLNVATSLETLADLTRAVGGDAVSVTALAKGSQDPHFVDPRPSLLIALNKADLVVYVGLDLEKGWLPVLINQARNAKIRSGKGNLDVSTTAGIAVLDRNAAVTRAQGDIHPQGNPHYWLPPDNARKIARALAARLKELDPSITKAVDANLQAWERKLDGKQAGWQKLAAQLEGVKVVSYHKSWGYVESWLGLIHNGEIEPKPGVPPSASGLTSLILTMRKDGVKAVLVESYYSRNTAQTVADKGKARLVVLPADVNAVATAKDYFSLVDTVLAGLVAATR